MIDTHNNFLIIAGPCAIETKEECFIIAEACKKICEKFGFSYTFKASYKKANRTTSDSFRGVGLDQGLKILSEVKNAFSLPILTDIHETDEDHMSDAEKAYLHLADFYPNTHLVSCAPDGAMRSRKDIHEEIIQIIESK